MGLPMSVAVICSGQGAQTPALFAGTPFTERGLAVRDSVIAAGVLPPDVAAWLDGPATGGDRIFLNHFSQPLICLYHAMVWAEIGGLLPPVELVAGYSLGELSAYGCAGAIDPVDCVRLAVLRSRLMDAAAPRGEMIAVTGLAVSRAADCGPVAIILADDHCVIGCMADTARDTAGRLLAAGAREARLLDVTIAAHTFHMDSAVGPFRSALGEAPTRDPAVPVLAGVSAVKVTHRAGMIQWLPEQIHRTIRWDQIQQRIAGSGVRVVLEIGPGTQLAHAMHSIGANARGLGEFKSFEGVAEWAAG